MSEPVTEFETDGYTVARGMLDPERDIRPLRTAYAGLLDELFAIYAGKIASRDGGSPSFPERLAMSLGASGGGIWHHIDPALNILEPGYAWRQDLPDPRIPELFRLMRHPLLLDALEGLTGPRITVSPIHHLNIKLPVKLLKLARSVNETSGAGESRGGFRGFQIGRTQWHMDAIAGLRDSHASRIVNAWIPMTSATEVNGCLRVVPGSHRGGVRYPPYPPDLDARSVPLTSEPGDVIFMDNKLLHSSMPNVSDSDYRWAFNFRYLPSGQPTGRPFLPEFIAREPTAPDEELHDPGTWSDMWRGCLTYHHAKGMSLSYKDVSRLSVREAAELTRYWKTLAPSHDSWVHLGHGRGHDDY